MLCSTFQEFHWIVSFQTSCKLKMYEFLALTFLSLKHVNTLNCSEIFCATRQSSTCTTIDEKCSCQENEIFCSTLNENPITFEYDKTDKNIAFSGQNNINTSVSDVITFFSPYIASLNPEVLSVTEFCNNTALQDPVTCKSMNPQNAVSFDLNNLQIFPQQLDLSNNCIRDISGIISKSSENVRFFGLEGNYFTQIPNFGQKLKNLIFLSMKSNFIHSISRKDFKLLTSLQEIYLSENCIASLVDDSFYDLIQLETLELQNNYLVSLQPMLLYKNILMIKLDLSHNQLEEISNNFFQHNLLLRSLYLSRNKIHVIRNNTFNNLKELQILDLSYNRLTSLPTNLFQSNNNLHFLCLSYNNLKRLPVLQFEWFHFTHVYLDHNNITILDLPVIARIPNATILDLSDNCIEKLLFHDLNVEINYEQNMYQFVCSKCCLTNDILPTILVGIHEVKLPQNNISKINVTALIQTRSKIFNKLDVSNNNISEIVFNEKDVLTSDQGHKMLIDFQLNPITCDCKLIQFISSVIHPEEQYNFTVNFDSENVYCNLPNELNGFQLRTINWRNLYCNITEHCPNKCHCLEYSYNKYTIVNCSSTGLTEFPMQFQYMPYDVIVDLKDNNITSLPFKNSSVWSRFRKLDLSHNKIKSTENLTVTDKLIDIRLNDNLLSHKESLEEIFINKNITRIVTLSGNPWQCNCDLIQLRGAIITSQIRLLDQDQLTCEFNNIQYGFNELDQFCASDLSLLDLSLRVALPIGALVAIVISALIVQFFRHKPEIQYYLFSRGWCMRFVSEDDVDADKKYDAFVSYSGLDGLWVRDNLVTNLEGENPTYKLCIHERDWPGGELIPEQIVRSVKESRRVIIVLTNNFLTSDWSLMEFTVAYQQSVNDRIRRLIVILPDEMPNLETAPDQLRAFLSTTTYLEASKPHFWDKLKSSMPRIK